MKYFLILLLFTSLLSITACQDDDGVVTPIASSCNFSAAEVSANGNYDFNDVFEDNFVQTTRWESIDAVLQQNNGQVVLSATGSQISEAWLTAVQQMPYNKSWEFSVMVNVPLSWNTATGNEPQVGVGIFAGKQEPNGPSRKVYECNLAVVGNGERFVQGQLVANRLGGDPIRVDHLVLGNNRLSAVLKLQYCASDHSLSLLIDDQLVGRQAIDASGGDNWALSDSDLIDIGIMGFAENTNINAESPTIDDFIFRIF